jgi:hypothetical protein
MEPSEARLAVLLEAAYDPDSTVRNNAVRGLGEWARQAPAWRARIPARIAIDLVRSGVWSDRNKGASLLRELTESRDESVLAEIRAVALPALREMAQWRWFGHNSDARAVLDRIR